jgi:hypothetical protein
VSRQIRRYVNRPAPLAPHRGPRSTKSTGELEPQRKIVLLNGWVDEQI